MYLKKLALAGFKSFAEPVELEFSKGVSAIVGPNGSGKSNITDAIRWVLGEQSTKSLRGKKMEDVIFSGTEKKKPLNYAEVTLTLDNTSGFTLDNLDEIVITRRLFRSGESEYRMNQKSCKLKDIHELFMDTGLGKNGYSLISQGGIENIIGASPQELRGIVEEAVGIVNYKTKKQEAEQNERTRARLAAETESLRNQTEEAEKKAQGLKNDYSVLENNYKVNLSQRDYLKSVQKNYSDYFPSIRTIMNSREHLGDMINKVYGPVGELLSIPDRFTMAVDVALGAKSQNIVVEDVTTANQCINILKKQRAGRATFLPLDNLRYGRVEARDLEILSRTPGFEGIASELVEYGPRFKRVIESLLGRIVVAADFNAGRAIQKAIFGKYTVVTLEGEIFYPGGAIVGGYTKSGKQSPLFKKAEIEKLEVEMKRQDSEKLKIKAAYREAFKAYEALKEAAKKAELRLNSVEQERIKLARDNEGIRSLEQQMAMIHSQIETCISREKKVESEIRACRESSALHRTRCEVLKVETEELQAAVDEKRAALESFSTETREQTAISEALEQEIKDLNHQLILQNETKNNAEMAKNKLEMQMTHWEENIFESYDMNFVMVGDIYEALSQEDLDLSPENQRSLKGRMAAMGNVNVGAIEEYLELNERYGFMSAQYKDLTKAKGELERIIDSLYESMERQFAKQFAELQKKFTRIFGILFEGGKAHIARQEPAPHFPAVRGREIHDRHRAAVLLPGAEPVALLRHRRDRRRFGRP